MPFRLRSTLLLATLALAGCSLSPQAREARSLRAGSKYLKNKDYARAILEFNNAVQAVPGDAEGYYQLGLGHLGAGEVNLAALYFQKALDRNPGHTGAQLRIAELQSLSSNKEAVKDGLKRAQDILGRSPNNADALSVAGLAELRLGQGQEAEKHLEQALARFPAHLQASVNLARAKLLQKDLAGAEAVLQNAVAQAPHSPDPLLALGQFYRIVGRPADAERQLVRALAIDPKNISALTDLAQIQWRANRLNEAEETFRRLSAVDAHYRLAHPSFLFATGKHDQAIAELQQMASATPDDREVRTALVTAYLAVNRTPDAEKVLGAALKKWPKDVDALLQRSRIYFAKSDMAKAEADVSLALSLRPESAEAHYLRSKVHQARGETMSRQEQLSEALSRDPGLAEARLDMSQVLLETNGAKSALRLLDEAPAAQKSTLPFVIQRNWIWLSLGEEKQAREQIDQVLATTRHPEVVLQDGMLKWKEHNYAAAETSAAEVLKQSPQDVRALELLMRSYMSENKTGAGTQKVREYAAQAPESVVVQRFLAKLLISNGSPDEARKVLDAAKALNPQAVDLYLDLADADMAEGKLDAARQYLTEMLASDTPDGQIRLKLAALEIAGGNYGAAIGHYRKVIQLNPRNSLALNNLAYLLSDFQAQPDEALRYAQQAKELSPNSATADDTLGWTYYRKGIYDLAVQYLESAVTREATAKRRYHLAMAYLKLGRRAKGKQVLDAALRADASLPEAIAARRLWTEVTARP